MNDDHALQAHESHINDEMFSAGQEPEDIYDDYESLDIVNVSHETDKAFLVELKSGFETWIPKSQCRIHNSGLMIFIPEWLKDKIKKDEKSKAKNKHVKKKAVCNYCQRTNVVWLETDRGWRLYNKKDSSPHMCMDEPPKGIK